MGTFSWIGCFHLLNLRVILTQPTDFLCRSEALRSLCQANLKSKNAKFTFKLKIVILRVLLIFWILNRYHRGIIVQWLNDCSNELDFTREMLRIDGKNYHCWQHRQLVLNHFKLWEGEVEFTTVLLDEDIRNNSAWNQRYYAIKNTTGFVKETVECEIG